MRRPSPIAAVVVLTAIALSLPFTLAVATSAFAQEPEPPSGEPQPPSEEPPPPSEEPAPTPGGQTGGGSTLPRTGSDALLYFALGVVLLLAGARLRVLTRIREVGQRVAARLPRRTTDVALREALEPIRAARLRPPEPETDPAPLHVEPSTPTAKRLTNAKERVAR